MKNNVYLVGVVKIFQRIKSDPRSYEEKTKEKGIDRNSSHVDFNSLTTDNQH